MSWARAANVPFSLGICLILTSLHEPPSRPYSRSPKPGPKTNQGEGGGGKGSYIYIYTHTHMCTCRYRDCKIKAYDCSFYRINNCHTSLRRRIGLHLCICPEKRSRQPRNCSLQGLGFWAPGGIWFRCGMILILGFGKFRALRAES